MFRRRRRGSHDGLERDVGFLKVRHPWPLLDELFSWHCRHRPGRLLLDERRCQRLDGRQDRLLDRQGLGGFVQQTLERGPTGSSLAAAGGSPGGRGSSTSEDAASGHGSVRCTCGTTGSGLTSGTGSVAGAGVTGCAVGFTSDGAGGSINPMFAGAGGSAGGATATGMGGACALTSPRYTAICSANVSGAQPSGTEEGFRFFFRRLAIRPPVASAFPLDSNGLIRRRTGVSPATVRSVSARVASSLGEAVREPARGRADGRQGPSVHRRST